MSKGDYSDYTVVGVYSSLELARTAAQLFGAEARVDDDDGMEMDDVPCVPDNMLAFHVYLDKEGNKPNNFINIATLEDASDFEPSLVIYETITKAIYLQCKTWARDKQHAIKIANEKRTQIIALGRWEPGVVTL